MAAQRRMGLFHSFGRATSQEIPEAIDIGEIDYAMRLIENITWRDANDDFSESNRTTGSSASSMLQ